MTNESATPRARVPKDEFARAISFRIAGSEDVSAIVLMVNDAYLREAWLLPAPRTTGADLLQEVGRRHVRVVVAEHNGALAGCVRVRLRDDGAWFGWLATDTAYQGRGLASLLVREAERVASGMGAGVMRLDCARELGLAPYYESLGYGVESVEQDAYFGPGKGPITRVVLKKELP